ncbi:MAG: hypothetical protein IEMM0008_0115 [bacterium]|nr:MAG: hypothetical protein IEMM0008_0115 [bacterium]
MFSPSKTEEESIPRHLLGKVNIDYRDSILLYDAVESQKSILNMVDTLFKELQTMTVFYYQDCHQMGIDEEFEQIKRLIGELLCQTVRITTCLCDDFTHFNGAVEGQRSFIQLIDHLINELRTTILFHYPECHQMGIDEQFTKIKNLIEEFFELTDSLHFFKVCA